MSGPSLEQSIVVQAPPDAVCDLVSDVTRTGEWSPVCASCWWDEGAGPWKGAWSTGRNEVPGRTWETRSQVVAAEPGREFAFVVGGTRAREHPGVAGGDQAHRRAGRAGERPGRGSRCTGMDLTCPKCHGSMRTYERNGVHVDQCTECRGIFLDRGELERLVDAEDSWNAGAPAAAANQQPRRDQPGSHQPQQAAQGGIGSLVGEVLQQARSQQSSSHHGQQRYKPRKKSSFLGELFG